MIKEAEVSEHSRREAGVRVHNIAERYEFTNKRIADFLNLSEPDFDESVEWIIPCIKNGASDFQKFLLHYFGEDDTFDRAPISKKLIRWGFGRNSSLTKSLNRFALSVALITKFCPRNGRWFDAGSLGHDALRVKLVRPDIEINIVSYEGCIIYVNETGLHYYDGHSTLPYLHVQCKQQDIENDKLDFLDNSVELVTAFEVLEHLKFAPQQFLFEINRILKPDGYLIITTPNACSASAISRIIHGQHPAENAFYHRIPGAGRIHPLEYTMDQLNDLVASHGFSIVLMASINMAPFDKAELKVMSVVRAARPLLYGRHLYGIHPGEFGEKWLLIAKKKCHISEPQYPNALFE